MSYSELEWVFQNGLQDGLLIGSIVGACFGWMLGAWMSKEPREKC